MRLLFYITRASRCRTMKSNILLSKYDFKPNSKKKQGLMELSQEFEIINTYKSKIYITTTGISEMEKEIIRKMLPSHIILDDELTPLTTYLVSYKSMINDKFIQAMMWNVKFVSIDWLYNVDTNPNKYLIKPIEGIEFSYSGNVSEIHINYLTLLGGVYNETLRISTDFHVTCNDETEEINYCEKYKIPRVRPEDVFKNNFVLYKKPVLMNALRVSVQNAFSGKIIYIDPRLPTVLFNLLKKLIILNEGIRVSVIDSNLDYVVTSKTNDIKAVRCKIVHYQYILDCVEAKSELMINSYIIHHVRHPVLTNVVCCIHRSLAKHNVETKNKLLALGCVLKDEKDILCTHMIVKDKSSMNKDATSLKIVSSEWIDQCLYTMKHEKEDRFIIKKRALPLFTNAKSSPIRKHLKKPVVTEKCFQFTSLPSFFKNKAVELFDKLNIKYVISDRYENCTHLIMGNISTSEKFISALSNGAWILTPEFIDNFDNSLDFDYEKYEWKCDESMDQKDIKIIQSIKKWRERVAKNGYPAFYKWKVLLFASESKRENYRRIIENGGGTILQSGTHTHCFVGKNYSGKVSTAKSHSTDYIFAYLFR